MTNKDFKFVDLFAGIGGFHQALEQEGGQCVMAVELDKNCQKVYQELFKASDHKLVSNIRDLTLLDDGTLRPLDELSNLVPDHDMLCGGFPCQPFSKAGKQLGVEDTTRGTLFFDIVRIILAKKPKFILLENVKNLVSMRHTNTWLTILKTLEDAGYSVSNAPQIMSPHKFSKAEGGSPQLRERVFIMAVRHDGEQVAPPSLDLPDFYGYGEKGWSLEDILDEDETIPNIENYRLSGDRLAWFNAWQAFTEGVEAETLPGFPIWVDAFKETPDTDPDISRWKQNFLNKNSEFYNSNKAFIDTWLKVEWGDSGTVLEFPPSRRKFEWQAGQTQTTRQERDMEKLLVSFRASGVRVKSPSHSPALTATASDGVWVGSRKRKLTPKECARLQGMDADRFNAAIKSSGVSDSTAYKQLGNAVNVGVVKIAVRSLMKTNNTGETK
tara:strand:+ start:212 stop:1531 length:1320 start_codon:yes stop_codon:yes gene_type:complete